MENYKIDTKYNFIDALSTASTAKRTLKEVILATESSIADPRAKNIAKMLFNDENALDVYASETKKQALFAQQMKTLFGDSEEGLFLDNAPIGAFATNALERLDMNVRRQALRTYATRDLPFQYGGGALESVKGFKEAYQLPKGGFIGGDTNQVRLVNVDFHPQFVPVKPLTYGLRLGLIDSMKNEMVGFDAISKMGEAIQKAWYLDLDRIAYVGARGENGSTSDSGITYLGLLNYAGITPLNLETQTTYTQGGAVKRLELMHINAVIEIILGELNKQALEVDFERDFMSNKILFYKELFAFLNSTAQNASGDATPFRTNKAILQEALDGWCDTQGFDRIEMVMLPYLSNDISGTKDASMVASGTNTTGRIVMYRQDPYVGYIPLPMDLTGGAVVFDINTNAFRKNYLSFVGYLLQFYPECIRYIDNGTATGE